MRRLVIEKALNPFTYSFLQDVMGFFRYLKSRDITAEEFISWYEKDRKSLLKKRKKKLKKQQKNLKRWLKVAKRCPDCGIPMKLLSVDANNCIWECPKCFFSILSDRSKKNELKVIGYNLTEK